MYASRFARPLLGKSLAGEYGNGFLSTMRTLTGLRKAPIGSVIPPGTAKSSPNSSLANLKRGLNPLRLKDIPKVSYAFIGESNNSSIVFWNISNTQLMSDDE